MKKNKSVTAVEWLIEKLDQNFDYVADTLIEQAKAMEKQQMKNAVLAQSTNHEGLRKIFDKQFEEYYNETFNK
jgi:hypothetical protein